jgi:hypothetical protein
VGVKQETSMIGPRRALLVAACLGLALALLPCAPSSVGGPTGTAVGEPTASATTAQPTALPVSATGTVARSDAGPSPTMGREARLTPEATRLPERAPAATAQPGLGEVPVELLAAIVADVARRQGIAADEVTVVRAEAIVWRDGSLGCPRPGMNYTQALVEGYWVILQHGDRSFDYRATDRGYFMLCQNPSAAPPGAPGGRR